MLVDMAETQPESGFVRRTVAYIRPCLRANVPIFMEMRASNDEINRDFILSARKWVKDGASAALGSASAPLAAAK